MSDQNLTSAVLVEKFERLALIDLLRLAGTQTLRVLSQRRLVLHGLGPALALVLS